MKPTAPKTTGPWTLATRDTSLTLALRGHALHVTHLGFAGTGWNWADETKAFPFLPELTVGGQAVAADWLFAGERFEPGEDPRLVLSFRSATTGLELVSEWLARRGPGPVRHALTLRNASDRPVGLASQPSLHFELNPPPAVALRSWHFSDEGGGGKFESPGITCALITPGYTRRIVASPGYDHIPLVILDASGTEGVYAGMEWSHSHFTVTGRAGPAGLGVALVAGNPADFRTELAPGEIFEVPPGFIGAYQGDVDEAGNSLRKYLLAHSMPAELRDDPTYPKLEWNAFTATGMCPTSQMDPKAWDPVEAKYYPLLKAVAALGFEEMTVDVGWWSGAEPDSDPTDWPRGLRAASEATRQLGLRLVLYWTDAEPMATPAGRATRARRVKRLFAEHGAHTWRSDATRGPVCLPDYWSVKGFYALLDALHAEVPGFQWENCSGGGPIKDYGAMRRATKIQICDTVDDAIVTRRVFHDSAYALHPIQMQGFLGWHNRTRPGEPGGLVYDFRSAGLGAFMWWIDSPNPTNGGIAWTEAEKKAVAREVHTYKSRLRPLIRSANLYHVLPRPDGVNWDGIEYFDPATGRGVVVVFKPGVRPDLCRIQLKGLVATDSYRLTFEDGSNPAQFLSGAVLAREGFAMTLRGTAVSELVWLERA